MINGLSGTKRRIFEAAADLFARDGYYSVSMKQVAAAVNIKAASIYNHFSSKEEILHMIYQYFDQQMEHYAPDLEDLLKRAGTDPVMELMQSITMVFSEEDQNLMGKCMLVTSSMSRFDPVANETISRNLLDTVSDHVRPLLHRLIELDRIEPIDVESFVLVISNYCYAAATRFYLSENRAISDDNFVRAMDMIYSLIREK